jgi:hypothetical protein
MLPRLMDVEHMESQIRANAELVRSVARDQLAVIVDYDEAGVRWLDQYIDGQRDAAPEVRERLISTLGSYLGECVRHQYGGRWLHDPEMGWSVAIADRFSVYPFNKVRKQLAGDDGESVLSFFTTIAPLLSHVSKRPWWKFW